MNKKKPIKLFSLKVFIKKQTFKKNRHSVNHLSKIKTYQHALEQ